MTANFMSAEVPSVSPNDLAGSFHTASFDTRVQAPKLSGNDRPEPTDAQIKQCVDDAMKAEAPPKTKAEAQNRRAFHFGKCAR